ncbi:Serine/threonine kinase [Tumidithrix helvetica PCC 7403]|uniref:caspase, EACC1-associated type n=1 Tax=Tumidithrix helvetica TaxID=3457545 RepID=UPI003C9D39C8
MGRYALLVGNSNYTAGLNPLPSAVRDVEALREVLVNPEVGGFAESDVTVLKDVEKGEIETAIHNLFANRKTDDLLLFYFSGHGVTDSRSDFYFTVLSTSKDALPPTAMPSDYVHKAMNQSRSKRQVIILDCCHSGAFPKGMPMKNIDTVNVLPKLGGEGRAILTASSSTQYAFEQEGFDLSLYTHFLVEGLKTGAAAKNDNEDISVEDLYEYVRDKVKSTNDNMSPEFYPVKEGHRIVLAKAAQGDPKLKFRKEAEKTASNSNGRISTFAKKSLDLYRIELKIDRLEGDEIVREVLRPYVEYAKKLEEYEQDLKDEIAQGFPFSKVVLDQLDNYENLLGLREEDIKEIKHRILTPKQVEYERQLREIRTQEVTEWARQQQSMSSMLDQLRQQAKEEERLKQQSTSTQFEFDIVQVKLDTKIVIVPQQVPDGFLGLGRKSVDTAQKQVIVSLERKRGKAEYIRLDLGNGVTLDLVNIPAGKFMMGSNEHDSEKPIHEVTLSSFWMGKCVVTNSQWEAMMGTKPSEKYDVKFQGKNQPVVGVLWDDCKEFCKKLSEKTKKNVRLPSEAEWEYACRAGTTTPFHFGETITPELVNYYGNHPYAGAPKGEYREKTVDVESFSPNAWGLYQMHGNVWEWCEDVWHENYQGAPTDGKSWLNGGDRSRRALRGGSWCNNAINCRSASRCRLILDVRIVNFGFRVVVS